MTDQQRALRVGAAGVAVLGLAMTVLAVAAAASIQAAGSFTVSERYPIVAALAGLTFVVVGVVILWRQPRNPIAWSLLVAGTAVQCETAIVALITLTHDVWDTDPRWVEVAAVVTDALWLPAFAAGGTVLFLLFPNGRLPSPRWRVVLWVVVGLAVAWIPTTLVADSELYAYESVRNPLTVQAVAPVAGAIQFVAGLVVSLGLVVGVAALVVRWRGSAGVERQQLKYLLLPPVGFAVAVAAGIVAPDAAATAVLIELVPAAVPLAIGAAITRRGLWGIDRLLSRTLAYTIVVAVLAACYLGSVLVLGTVAREVTGASHDIVVALSTLAVAALFQPLRRRVGALIDRRFDRARYDAARTIDAFGRRLRDEVALEAVVAELRRTASTTFAPASVGLLLAHARASGGGR